MMSSCQETSHIDALGPYAPLGIDGPVLPSLEKLLNT